MSKRIIYANVNGSLSIVVPSPECLDLDVEAKAELARMGLPVDHEYEIVESSSIPVDRTFRNAWKKEGRDYRFNYG